MRSRVIFAVLVVLMTLLAGTIYAGGGDTLEVTQERGYRIEVVTEKDEQQVERPKEVHFVSPAGKIVAKIKYS
ncbi:hypothetical protein DRP53_04520, partial [candidate division WOR-3 bacterium]